MNIDQITTKIPPNDIEAEKAILGSILNEKSAFSIARTFISPDAFYSPQHNTIYLACERLFSSNEPIDLITVMSALRAEKKGSNDSLKNIGGAVYLIELSQTCSSSANIEPHCRIVTEMWMRRLLAHVSSVNASRSFDYTYDVFDLLSKSQGELNKITEKLASKRPSTISELSFKVISDLGKKLDESYYTPTGITNMDNFSKLCGGDLVILAGRPGMGKTSVAVNMLLNAGILGIRGMFFSLEMPEEQIVQKMLSAQSGVPYWKIRERKCDPFEMEYLTDAYEKVKDIVSLIDGSTNICIEEIKAKVIAENTKAPLSFVIIDYLQFIKPSAGHGTRDQEIGHITRTLKGIAKDLNIPVIALAQLSREVEKRADKRPQLSDLRESGNIEQDADTVIFCFRPEYYGIMVDANNNSLEGIAEINYAKNRHGGTGAVMVNCKMDIGKFW